MTPSRVQASAAANDARDPLTGLVSTQRAVETLREWQAQTDEPVQAMLIALGELRSLNMAFGHAVGDSVLVEIARRIVHFIEDEFAGDAVMAARAGGSSFLVAYRGNCTRERWQWLAEALAEAIAAPFRDGDDVASIRLWPRVILARGGVDEPAGSLFDKLGDGLTSAGHGGSARIGWASGVQGSFGASRRQLERDFLSAIDQNQIRLLYQPQYSVTDDRVVGAEALARWEHPQYGQLGASTLLTLAARTEHSSQLSRYLVAQALKDAASWPGDLHLSVNITPADLAESGLGAELIALADAAGLPMGRLTVEITEQVLLIDMITAQATLTQLRAQGASIALDDFGAGFCNFRYLKLLPLDLIKLDRTMIDGILDDPRDLAVLRGIVAMARALDLGVVVEGIEHEAQRALIAAEGCSSYQGFLRSPPIDAVAFASLVSRPG